MPTTDKFDRFPTLPDSPGASGVAITPDDANQLTEVTRAVYVGGDGDIAATLANDEDSVTFVAVPAGTILPLRVLQLHATGTTATNIIGLY